MLHEKLDTFEFDIRSAILNKMCSTGCSYREAVLELNEIVKELAHEVRIVENAINDFIERKVM